MKNVINALQGRTGLVGIHALLLGETMRRELRHSLAGLLAPGYQLSSCRLQRAKFKPGRKLTASFAVQVLPPEGEAPSIRPVEVVWRVAPDAETLVEPPAMEQEAVACGLAAPFRQLQLARPTRQMHLQLAPLDARFPQLVRLCTPAYVTALLQRIDAAPATEQTIICPIRYRPGQRHVLGYASATKPEQPRYFAKLYQSDTGQMFYQMAQWIADLLGRSPVSVAGLRPLAYQSADQVILYRQVDSMTLAEQLRRPTRRTANDLVSVGQALRALHSAQPPVDGPLPTLDLSTEIKTVLRTSEHICCLLPTVGAQIHELIQRAAERLAGLPPEPPTFVHGDMKADHLFVQPAGLTLFDFDACALADPALDLGKFLADLCWWYTTYHQAGFAQAQAAVFLGYGLPVHHPRRQRAWCYAVMALLKMTAHRVPLFAADWATRTRCMVEQAARLQEGCP